MKAVILETKDGYCAVLKDDGTVEKIKMTGEVGQEITMPVSAEIRRFPIRRVAAAAVAVMTIASGLMSQLQEYSYVSVDVDASVEYSLNRMDRVISVKALNKKGEELAESVRKEGVQGSSLDKAVEKTASVLQKQGYVDSDDGVLMSVSSKSEKKSVKLAEKVENALAIDDVSSAVEKVSMADRKDAQDSGLSAGRYVVTKGIVGSDSLDEAAIDAARNTSTEDLIQLAEEIDTTVGEDAAQTDANAKDDEKKGKADKDAAADADLCEEINPDAAQPAEEEELAPPLAPLEDAVADPVTEETDGQTQQVKSEDATEETAPETEGVDEAQPAAEDTEESETKDEAADTKETKVSEPAASATETDVKAQAADEAAKESGAAVKPSAKSGSKETTKTESTKTNKNKKTGSSKTE